MKIHHHRLDGATWKPLKSGGEIAPRYLVVHNTVGGTAASSISYLKTKGFAYHLLIDRDGKIYQCAPLDRRASHSGSSNWKNENSLNDVSIGIALANYGELKPKSGSHYFGTRKVDPAIVHVASHKNGSPSHRDKGWEIYPKAQLDVLEEVCKVVCKEYGILNILGHDDISIGRKVDPGPALDLDAYRPFARLDLEKRYQALVQGTGSSDVLNVRDWRHPSSKKVDELKLGDLIYLLSTPYVYVANQARRSNWVSVSRDGIHHLGYVHSSYLRLVSDTPDLPEGT